MLYNEDYQEPEEMQGAGIQVLGTDPEEPEEGRIFVWTKMGWFERLVGPLGNVAFSRIANSEAELREYILQTDRQADLYALGDTYVEMVSDEFETQTPSLSDPVIDTLEGPDEDESMYHQHDFE